MAVTLYSLSSHVATVIALNIILFSTSYNLRSSPSHGTTPTTTSSSSKALVLVAINVISILPQWHCAQAATIYLALFRLNSSHHIARRTAPHATVCTMFVGEEWMNEYNVDVESSTTTSFKCIHNNIIFVVSLRRLVQCICTSYRSDDTWLWILSVVVTFLSLTSTQYYLNSLEEWLCVDCCLCLFLLEYFTTNIFFCFLNNLITQNIKTKTRNKNNTNINKIIKCERKINRLKNHKKY